MTVRTEGFASLHQFDKLDTTQLYARMMDRNSQ